jgi:hypothetical protein
MVSQSSTSKGRDTRSDFLYVALTSVEAHVCGAWTSEPAVRNLAGGKKGHLLGREWRPE